MAFHRCIGNSDILKNCLKEPELPIREEDTTAEDLKRNAENLEKESERENAENESRSDRVGSVDQEVAAAVSQQPSFEKSDQVYILHYISDHHHHQEQQE